MPRCPCLPKSWSWSSVSRTTPATIAPTSTRKRKSANVSEDPEPAYQLRRYAWSAELPLSILTNFEELAVYDCRIKPDKNDKAHVARVLYRTYQEYAERWDEIAGIFSKDAVRQGSFDKYADSNNRKRGLSALHPEPHGFLLLNPTARVGCP